MKKQTENFPIYLENCNKKLQLKTYSFWLKHGWDLFPGGINVIFGIQSTAYVRIGTQQRNNAIRFRTRKTGPHSGAIWAIWDTC